MIKYIRFKYITKDYLIFLDGLPPQSIFCISFHLNFPNSLRVHQESKANQLEVWVVCHCSHPGLGLWPLLLSWAQCKVSEGHWPYAGQGEGLGPAGTEGIYAFQWDAWFRGWGHWLDEICPKKLDGNKHVIRWRCLLVTSWNWPCYDHTMTLGTWSKHVKTRKCSQNWAYSQSWW